MGEVKVEALKGISFNLEEGEYTIIIETSGMVIYFTSFWVF